MYFRFVIITQWSIYTETSKKGRLYAMRYILLIIPTFDKCKNTKQKYFVELEHPVYFCRFQIRN